ncbi:MAG: hypothetical protein WA057_04450 [Candidatus Magasanikiibacteriota bacterium]
MIKEFAFYHGAVLVNLLHGSNKSMVIESFPSESNASYVINKNTGIFIKHSTKRMSPWRFSFAQEHQDEILEMKNKLGEVFLLLVCGEDGIVTLSFNELKKILNETHDPVEWISIARNKNTHYTVKGSDGSLGHKVSRKDFPRKLFEKESVIKETKTSGVFSWFK